MGFWSKLFGGSSGSSKLSFRRVDWLDAEHRLLTIDALAKSTNQADAKQAIIQADVLFDSVMKQANVPGSTMGERLKSLKGKIPMPVYQKLWQAHLKRNELVHDAGSFVAEWEKQVNIASFKAALRAVRGVL